LSRAVARGGTHLRGAYAPGAIPGRAQKIKKLHFLGRAQKSKI